MSQKLLTVAFLLHQKLGDGQIGVYSKGYHSPGPVGRSIASKKKKRQDISSVSYTIIYDSRTTSRQINIPVGRFVDEY